MEEEPQKNLLLIIIVIIKIKIAVLAKSTCFFFFFFFIPYFEILVKSFSSKYTIITSSVPHNYVRYMIDSFRT